MNAVSSSERDSQEHWVFRPNTVIRYIGNRIVGRADYDSKTEFWEAASPDDGDNLVFASTNDMMAYLAHKRAEDAPAHMGEDAMKSLSHLRPDGNYTLNIVR